MSNLKPILFPFKTIIPCPVTVGPGKKSPSLFPICHLYILKGSIKIFPEVFLLQDEQSQLSQPVLIEELFYPSDNSCGPPLDQF